MAEVMIKPLFSVCSDCSVVPFLNHVHQKLHAFRYVAVFMGTTCFAAYENRKRPDLSDPVKYAMKGMGDDKISKFIQLIAGWPVQEVNRCYAVIGNGKK